MTDFIPGAASPDQLEQLLTSSTSAPAQADDGGLFDSLIAQESGGHQTNKDGTPLTSKRGAIGIAQLMPKTAPEAAQLAGIPYDDLRYRTDPEYNKTLGRAYFNKQLEDFGTPDKALAAYNAGPEATRQAIDRAAREGNPDGWLNYLPAETRAYVPAIMKRHGAVPSAQPAASASAGDGEQYYSPRQDLVFAQPPAPGATAGDYLKELLASAIDSVGFVGQAVGEVAAAGANDLTGTNQFQGKNVLAPVSQAIRDSSTPGAQAARGDQFEGDVFDPSTWKAPESTAGWAMSGANAFGSLLPMLAATLVPGLGEAAWAARAEKAAAGLQAAREAGDVAKVAQLTRELSAAQEGARVAGLRAKAIGAASEAAMTGGAAANDVRDSAAKTVAGMSHDELMQVPAYRQAYEQTDDEQDARQAVVNAAAQWAGGLSALMGAGHGAFNAKVLEDVLLQRGLVKSLGSLSDSRLVRAGVGAVGGHLAEGGQETAEQVGQNIGENIGLGRPALDNAGRDTLSQAMGGALVGGSTGLVVGATASHEAPAASPAAPVIPQPLADAAAQPNSPLSRAAVAGNTGPIADAARAQQAAQAQQGQVDPAERLVELERISQGTPETTNADGQVIPGTPGRFFTAKEQAEYKQLKAARDQQAAIGAQAQQQSQAEQLQQRVLELAEALKQPGVLDILRGEDSPVNASKVLNDLAIARSQSANQAQREQAINRIATALEWVGIQPAPTAKAGLEQASEGAHNVGRGAPEVIADPNIPALRAQADREAGRGVVVDQNPAQTSDNAGSVQDTSDNDSQDALIADLERKIADPQTDESTRAWAQHLLSAARDNRDAQANLQPPAAAATSAANEAAPAATGKDQPTQTGAAPAQTGEARTQVQAPEVKVAPAGSGPAAFRKRRAQLRKILDMGLTRVERRADGSFVLHDGGKREFALEGPAAAQLARAEHSAMLKQQAEAANTNPTDGQKQAGNYQKGHLKFDGLDISVENPKGSTRSGVGQDGKPWSVDMTAHYGYVKRTEGADGDQVDVYLPEHPRSGAPVWVFDQHDPKTGAFDEHKAVLGVLTQAEAQRVYDAHFSDGSGPTRRRAVTKMSAEEFKKWAQSGDAKKPARQFAQGQSLPSELFHARRFSPEEAAAMRKGANERELGHADNPATGRSNAAGSAVAAGGVDDRGARDGSEHAAAGDAAAGVAGASGEAASSDDDLRAGSDVVVRFDGKEGRVRVVRVSDGALASAQRGLAKARSVSDAGRAMLEAVAAIFGKRVAWFESNAEIGDGFVHPRFEGTIFLATSTRTNPMAVLGHEMFHKLKAEMPGTVWESIREVVASRVKDPDAFRRDYHGKGAKQDGAALSESDVEEITADLQGNLFMDPSFLAEVFDKIHEASPDEAKSLIAKLAAFIRSIVDAALQLLKNAGPQFRANAFVTDLGTIRNTLRDALAQYARTRGIAQTSLAAQVQRESTAQSKRRSFDVPVRRGLNATEERDSRAHVERKLARGVTDDTIAAEASEANRLQREFGLSRTEALRAAAELVRGDEGKQSKLRDLFPRLGAGKPKPQEGIEHPAEGDFEDVAEPAAPGNGSMRARPGANMKRLASLLGPQLYGDMSKVGSVTVKELFQNSFDALKAMVERGDLGPHKIDIRIDRDKRTISVSDNGNGMTPEIINKAFLTIAGTNKETDRSSGGFGVAKMLFLFGNESMELKTVRDGVESTMQTTGAQLMASFEDHDAAPEIKTRRTDEPSGTTVTVKIPDSYKDPSTGEEKSIDFPSMYEIQGQIERSPLFEPIEVSVNGSAEPVGSNFPAQDYTTFANVKFDWGNARIIVSKQEKPAYYNNLQVLSNGLWQFSMAVKKDPMDSYGDNVPRQFYLNIEPRVKPEDTNYPFALNRQGFSPATRTDINKILHYLSILYQGNQAAESAAGFGQVQYVSSTGKLSTPVQLAPKVDTSARKDLLHVNEGDEIVVKDGRMIVNGREVPTLDPKQISEARVDAAKFKIPQDQVDPARIMVHDNIDVELPGPAREKFDRITREVYAIREEREQARLSMDAAREQWEAATTDEEASALGDAFFRAQEKYKSLDDAYWAKWDEQAEAEKEMDGEGDDVKRKLPISDVMRERYGVRFDKYLHDVGHVFLELRNAIREEGGEQYVGIEKLPVGTSFDQEYFGVHFPVPFRGMFINPAITAVDGDLKNDYNARRMAISMVGTMVHEIAHFVQMNHSTNFISEMQRANTVLAASENFNMGALVKRLAGTLEKYADIYRDLNETVRGRSVSNRGVKLEDAQRDERRDGAAADVAGQRPAGQGRGDEGLDRQAEGSAGDRARRGDAGAVRAAAGDQGAVDESSSDIIRSADRDNADDEHGAGAEPATPRGENGARAVYGTSRAGSVSAVGIHYSQRPRSLLDATAYGTGAKGLERERLSGRDNDDIRPRTFFYVDKGNGVRPEAGVGGAAHRVLLRNLYDVQADPLRLVKDNPGPNNWERAIMRAGFDGYLNMDDRMPQGYAVVLGKQHRMVPVEPIASPGFREPKIEPERTSRALMSKELGAVDVSAIPGAVLRNGTLTVPQASREAANREMERIGSEVRFSKARDIPETPGFKRWFAGSKAVTADGKPLVVYHGTNADFSAFDPQRLGESTGHATAKLGFYFSAEPDVAYAFTGAIDKHDNWRPMPGGNLMPVYLSIKNPKVIRAGEFMHAIKTAGYGDGTTLSQTLARIREPGVLGRLFGARHDGIHVIGDPDEHFNAEVAADLWIAFRPTQIKSAIGNSGVFDATDPDITRSARRVTDEQARAAGDARKRVAVLEKLANCLA